MSATQKVNISKLGILAGSGRLPHKIISDCKKNNIEVFIIGFEGQTPTTLKEGHKHLWTGIASAGKIIKTLKNEGIKDIVFAGSIKRPSISELKPDLKGMEIIAKIGVKALGDDGLLNLLKNELEKEGFCVHGAHDFSDDLLAGSGAIGSYEPEKQDWESIRRGWEVSQALGLMDVGQSVIVQNGVILGVEAAEGTDALIDRCTSLQKKGRGGILVKTCKPQQDKNLDMPTIGSDTVIKAASAGLCGIIIHEGASIILDPEIVAQYADKYKIFVFGVDLTKP